MTQPTATLGSRSAEVTEHGVYRKVFWRIVPLLMLCYVISYLNRVNVGFAKLEMGQVGGFSDTVFGLGAGVFFLGYFLFELPSNLLMQKIGARVWIARIMITWGLLSAAFCFVKTPGAFYVMRFLLGAAEAGFFPGVILYLTYWYPAHRRAKIVAMFMSAIPVAGMLGNPLSGWIMDAFRGSSGLQGWQWMFVLEGVPAVLTGIAIVFLLDSSVANARWLTGAEKEFLSREVAADMVMARKGPHSVLGVLRNRYVWVLCLIYFALTMGQYGLTFWMPSLIDSTGVRGNMKIGLLSAVPFLCAIVAMNLCGRSSDRLRERRWHLVVPALVAAVGFTVVASFAHNTTLSIVFLSLAAAGVLTCTPLFWSLPTAFLSGTAAAAGIAVINSIGNLAGFVSPFLIGYLKDSTHSTRTGMYVLSAILLLGAATVWSIPPKLVNH